MFSMKNKNFIIQVLISHIKASQPFFCRVGCRDHLLGQIFASSGFGFASFWGVIDRYHGDASSDLVIPGQVLCAIGSGASLVSISWGSNPLVEGYKEYLGSGYMHVLLDYRTFDARLLKRCLQKTASTVFGTLDPFSMTELIVTRLKGAENHHRMQTRQSLRKATETGDLSLPGLVDVVSNLVGVWPPTVSHLKKTVKKDSDDSLLVWFLP